MPAEPLLPTWTPELSLALQGLAALVVVLGALFTVWKLLVPELKIRVSPRLSEEVKIGDRRAISVRAEVSAHWGSVLGCTVFVTKFERWFHGTRWWWMDLNKGRHQLQWTVSPKELAQDVHPNAPGLIVVAVAFQGEDDLRSGTPDDQPLLPPGKYRLTLMAAGRASGDRVRRTSRTVILDWHGSTAWDEVALEDG